MEKENNELQEIKLIYPEFVYKRRPSAAFKDETGNKYGKLTVLYRGENNSKGDATWICKCECGNIVQRTGRNLRTGNQETKSCGCEKGKSSKIDLTNQKFGRLTVLYDTGKRSTNGNVVWHCICECGNEKDIDGGSLRYGKTKSCGCLQKEKATEHCKQIHNEKDITNQRFGKLIALYPTDERDSNGSVKWCCKCDCGKETKVRASHLLDGYIRSCGCIDKKLHSKPNDNFSLFLKENNINFLQEYKINNKFYDFAIIDEEGKIKKLIEINPTATHNVEWSPFGSEHKSCIDKYYHRDKTKLAKDNGYNCMILWDWDNQTAITNYFIGQKEKIYARDCEIKTISNEESKELLNNYHFQGYAKAQIIYALQYGGEIVSIMSFGSPRYNHNFEWEIIRYCSSKNVIGGAEKLFNHFINDRNPNSIISYCDLSKFSGDIYKKLGFSLLRNNPPSLHWYNTKNKKHYTDNLIRQHGVSRIVNNCEPEEDEIAIKANTNDNYKLMLLNGYLPVYDCGQQTWIWSKE